MPGALDGVRILDLSWGIAGPLGVLLLAEQGADVIKVEPPGGDPFRAYDGYRVWNRSRRSLTVDLKSDAGRDVFERLLGNGRRGGRVVPAGRDGATRLRLRIGARRAPTRHLPLVPRVSRRPPLRATPGLRRAGAGEQRADVGAAGLAHGPDLPAHADAVDGRVLPHLHRRAHRVDRPGDDRARPARQTSLFAGAMLYTTQIWQHLEKSNAAAARADGQDVPARHPPADDLRVRRRLGARVGHERAHADQVPGRDPRARGRARPVHVHGAAARGTRGVQRETAGEVQGVEARRHRRRVPGAQPRDRGDHHRPTSSSRTRS